MRSLLTNEERLRRLRERWARQAAERRKERTEAGALPKLTSGLSHERLITPHMMAMGEAYFWGKRGITFQRDFNHLPTPVRDRTPQLATALGAGTPSI
jgi:hypothetical protein